MSECKKIKELLSEYLDAALDEENTLLVKEHLLQCQVCRKELDDLRKMSETLQNLEKTAAPQDFLDKLHTRIKDRKSIDSFLINLLKSPNLKVPVAVCLMILVVFAVLKSTDMFYPTKTVYKELKKELKYRVIRESDDSYEVIEEGISDQWSEPPLTDKVRDLPKQPIPQEEAELISTAPEASLAGDSYFYSQEDLNRRIVSKDQDMAFKSKAKIYEPYYLEKEVTSVGALTKENMLRAVSPKRGVLGEQTKYDSVEEIGYDIIEEAEYDLNIEVTDLRQALEEIDLILAELDIGTGSFADRFDARRVDSFQLSIVLPYDKFSTFIQEIDNSGIGEFVFSPRKGIIGKTILIHIYLNQSPE